MVLNTMSNEHQETKPLADLVQALSEKVDAVLAFRDATIESVANATEDEKLPSIDRNDMTRKGWGKDIKGDPLKQIISGKLRVNL